MSYSFFFTQRESQIDYFSCEGMELPVVCDPAVIFIKLKTFKVSMAFKLWHFSYKITWFVQEQNNLQLAL